MPWNSQENYWMDINREWQDWVYVDSDMTANSAGMYYTSQTQQM